MNSTFKSVGKNFPPCFLSLGLAFFTGCKSGPGPEAPLPSVQVRDQLEAEVSLKADREELSKIRHEIPAQKQKTNDELALMLQLMGEVKLKPSEVSSRFQNQLQKRRSEFREKVSRLRADYRVQEAQRKEDFLKKQKEERDSQKTSFLKKEARARFYSDHEKRAQDFFANERNRRRDFESEIETQSKDFDSYMKEKQKEFFEQHRLYSKRFSDVEKETRKQTKDKSKSLAPEGSGFGSPTNPEDVGQ